MRVRVSRSIDVVWCGVEVAGNVCACVCGVCVSRSIDERGHHTHALYHHYVRGLGKTQASTCSGSLMAMDEYTIMRRASASS